MKKNLINKFPDEYKKVIKTLLELRPICHIVSAITSICFVLVLILMQKEIEPYLLYFGIFSYIIVAGLSVLVAFYYEQKVESVIDALGFVLAKNHSKRLIAALAIIAAPLLFVAGSTSFVGSFEVASQSADKLIDSEMSQISERIEKNSNIMLNERKRREHEFVESRKLLRASISQKYQAILKEIPLKNSKRFDKSNSNDWHFKELQRANSQDSSRYLRKMNSELEAHDKQTASELKTIHEKTFEAEQAESESNESKLLFTKKRTENKVNRFEWFGKFFGFVAIIALIISLICSIAAHQICEALNISAKQLKNKRGILNNLSPTPFNKSKNKGSQSDFSAHSSSFGGVGEQEQRIELLKKKAENIVFDMQSGDIELSKQAHQEMIEIISQLEGQGVEVFWADENQTEIKFK